ncbi:MAG: lipoprotein [Burkholderiales bacterium]
MRPLIWLCLAAVIAGCGYKGPLKLPEPANPPAAKQQKQ